MAKRNRSQKRKKERQQEMQKTRMIIAGVGAIVFLLIAGLVFYNQSLIPNVSQERLELDPYLGNPDAPVTIMEYAAYGCEACKIWHESGVIEQIIEEFPNQVRYTFRDMPIIMPAYSQDMAEVAQCALDQGEEAYWTMHDALFTMAVQGRTTQSEAILLGSRVGLDGDALESCVDANTHVATVRYDLERGEKLGIRSAPTWFINGERVYNASPDILQQMITEALNS